MHGVASATIIHRKRRYWHDLDRNGAVVEMANAIAAKNLTPLWQRGVLSHATAWQDTRSTAAIVVESIEHGRALKLRLPDWNQRKKPASNAVRP